MKDEFLYAVYVTNGDVLYCVADGVFYYGEILVIGLLSIPTKKVQYIKQFPNER